jgi:hypothetical protein
MNHKINNLDPEQKLIIKNDQQDYRHYLDQRLDRLRNSFEKPSYFEGRRLTQTEVLEKHVKRAIKEREVYRGIVQDCIRGNNPARLTGTRPMGTYLANTPEERNLSIGRVMARLDVHDDFLNSVDTIYKEKTGTSLLTSDYPDAAVTIHAAAARKKKPTNVPVLTAIVENTSDVATDAKKPINLPQLTEVVENLSPVLTPVKKPKPPVLEDAVSTSLEAGGGMPKSYWQLRKKQLDGKIETVLGADISAQEKLETLSTLHLRLTTEAQRARTLGTIGAFTVPSATTDDDRKVLGDRIDTLRLGVREQMIELRQKNAHFEQPAAQQTVPIPSIEKPKDVPATRMRDAFKFSALAPVQAKLSQAWDKVAKFIVVRLTPKAANDSDFEKTEQASRFTM